MDHSIVRDDVPYQFHLLYELDSDELYENASKLSPFYLLSFEEISMLDVAVVGAGLTGLACAQLLHRWGYDVAVFDKSRGLGGRVATRRVNTTCFDHGARFVSRQGSRTQQLLHELLAVHTPIISAEETQTDFPKSVTDQFVEHPSALPTLISWPRSPHQLDSSAANSFENVFSGVQHLIRVPQTDAQSYVPPEGMTAIAKFLAHGLDVRRQHRITQLDANLERRCWKITPEDRSQSPPFARAVILAVPAPQAIPLLESLTPTGRAPDWIDQVRAIEFSPCFSVIGGYAAQSLPLQADPQTGIPMWQMGDRHWDALHCPSDEILAWVGLDSSKSRHSDEPIIVFQSTDAFAATHVDDTDLGLVGDRILGRAAQLLNCPALCDPQWQQVQRWRYGFCRRPLASPDPYLITHQPLLLGCAGDWCSGSQIEDALTSGQAIAHRIHQALDSSSIP